MYKRLLFITFGFISLGLGIVGIFLPILPTTPFLLLAATLFAHSSQKLYDKLLANKYLGHYIRDFQLNRTIPLRAKIISISMIWLSIGSCVLFVVEKTWLKVMLFTIAFFVSIYILHFKTKR